MDPRPAGFSSRWLNDILRHQLGFGGAIFSDDLSMAGARLIEGREVSYTEAAIAALNAGCDMVLLCNQSVRDPRAVDQLLDGLAEAQLKERWHPSGASEQRRLALLPTAPAQSWDALMTHPDYIHALGLLPCSGTGAWTPGAPFGAVQASRAEPETGSRRGCWGCP